ncbi:transcriptional regulator [Solibacillus sp. R5-41]|uniref:helix-turn-helix transcriptional regulator n=1 Tax=Solibacillus sp. R5-41 TaxID=2048654 RepID=UPI000C127427|nr:helix-turn-helix transcriptional regulator [Solibacillus sp. R5-41]ATP41259.1 transcriptional regulator [Solibacillus sp. R5-41]
MDDRLKNLKKAMNESIFSQVEFTATHRERVQQQLNESQVEQHILSLLVDKKSGIELAQLLHARGVREIFNNEGIIYSILHEQENKGRIISQWDDTGGKYYQLTNSGLKWLRSQNRESKTHFKIKHRLLEVRLNEHF